MSLSRAILKKHGMNPTRIVTILFKKTDGTIQTGEDL